MLCILRYQNQYVKAESVCLIKRMERSKMMFGEFLG
jgi:hypothetical protein